MPVFPNQKELSQLMGQCKSNPPSGHPEKGGDEGHCHAKCPNEDQLLSRSCRLWGAAHDQSLLFPLPTSRKASGCCWQAGVVSIWGDSYCYREGENDLPSQQRLLSYLSSLTAGVASPRKALSTRSYHVSQDPLTFYESSAQWEASEHKLIDSTSFSETFMLIQYRLLMEFPFSEKISTSIENSTQSCSFSFQNFRSSLKNSLKP